MKAISARLNKIVDDHLPSLRSVSIEKFHFKPSPAKWSKKEILGHLVDSAQNNIRRVRSPAESAASAARCHSAGGSVRSGGRRTNAPRTVLQPRAFPP